MAKQRAVPPHFHDSSRGPFQCSHRTKGECDRALKDWRAAAKVFKREEEARIAARVAARREASFQEFVAKEAERVRQLLSDRD